MNIVTRELKNHKYILDRENKTVIIIDKNTNTQLVFDKIRMFSLIRFLISSSQKLTQQIKKAKVEIEKPVINDLFSQEPEIN